MSKYYVDPNWCFENPKDAAQELERLHKWCDDLERQAGVLRDALKEIAEYDSEFHDCPGIACDALKATEHND